MPSRRSATATQPMMVAGGAEELCPTEAAVFDTLFATSTRNDTPQRDAAAVRCRARRAGARRGRRDAGAGGPRARARARRAHLRRAGRLRHQLRRQPRHAAERRNDGPGDAAGARRRRRCPPRRSATSMRHGTATQQGDIAESQATAQGVRRAHADQLAEELHRPHARRLRRARGMDDDRDDAGRLVRRRPSTSSASIPPARRSTT